MSLENLLREVVSLLERARQVDKQAEERLSQLNSVEGFRVCLLRAATAQELLPDIRLMGAILLKNGIHHYWGPAAPTSLDRTEEKNMIKSGLLQAVAAASDKQVSAQLMACVAKIARIEWPEQWPQLFSSLSQLVQVGFDASNLQGVNRALDCLEQVLQELSSKRLPLHRRQFQIESSKLLPALTVVWKAQVETFLGLFRQLEERQKSASPFQKVDKLGAQDVAELDLRLRLALLLTQCLEWVVVFGIEDPGANQDAHAFFGVLLKYVQGLSEFRSGVMTLASLTGEARLTLHDSASVVCTTMAELVLKTQSQHAVSFVPFLGVYVSAFLTIFSESFDPDFPSAFKFEKLSIQALNFLSQVVACDKYGLDLKMDEEAQDEASQKAKDMVRSMITADVAGRMAQLLVSGFLPLSPAKLASWESEPEVFVHEEDVEDVDEGSTAAASGLLWGLIKAYPAMICPLLVNMLGEAIRACPPGASLSDDGEEEVSRAVLLKEAVYHALSIASVILMEQASMGLEFDIPTIYKDVLAKEISMTPIEDESMGSRIIQRRTILLIGDWIERIPQHLRPSVYEFTLRLLYHPDLLVSMAGLSTLHNILEDAAFDDDEDDDEDGGEGDEGDEENRPPKPTLDASGRPLMKATEFVSRYCQPICENIFRMIGLSEDLNTHEVLLDRLRLVISTAGSEGLSVCVPSITQRLSNLWSGSGEEILRAPILRTLSCIVESLGNRSEALQSVLLPLLMECLSHTPDTRSQQAIDAILNQTLRFWRELVHNARVPTESLFNLFERFPPLVERLCTTFTKDVELGSVKAAEDLYLLLSGVLVGYILLGGPSFMDRTGSVICRVLGGAVALQQQHDDEDFGVLQAMDFILQIFPQQSPALLTPVLQECLKHTLYLAQKPEASKLSAEEAEMAALVGDTPLIVKYLVLLARLIIVNTPALLNLLSSLPSAQQRHSLEVLLKSLVEFAPQMDALQTGLTAQACCCLLSVLLQGHVSESSCPWVPDVLRLISKVSRKPLHTARPLEELLRKHPEKAETEVQRKSALEHKDPVRTVVITQLLAEKMRELPSTTQMHVLAHARSNPKLEDLVKTVGTLLGLQQRSVAFHV